MPRGEKQEAEKYLQLGSDEQSLHRGREGKGQKR